MSDADQFISLVVDMCSHFRAIENAHSRLKENPDLCDRIRFFLADLMTFGADEEAQARLEADLSAPFYMSSTYFTAEEAELLLDFPTSSGLSFRQNLEVLIGEKMGQAALGAARDCGLCTAHDIAPVVREVFRINKGFNETKKFQAAQKAFVKKIRKAAKKHV